MTWHAPPRRIGADMASLRRLGAALLAVFLALAIAGPALACGDRDGLGSVVPGTVDQGRIAPTTAGTATDIVPGSVNRSTMSVRATYDVDAKLNFATRAFSARTTITLTNASGAGIDRVELNTIAARLGSLRLYTVTVDGRGVAARVSDQTITVPLGGVLPPGGTATIQVPYASTLRSSLSGSNWMFTRTNGIASIHRWIPWVSRATPFVRPNHGDPFVTPVASSVEVRLTTDRFLRVASTGTRVRISDDLRVQTLRAEDVRDFVLSAAPDYRWHDATVGDNLIRVAARPGAPASAMLAAAKRAFTRMEQLLGPYPYRVFTVAQSAGGYGMEGPGIVWIPTGVAASNISYLVTHETAHQWFYGIVGNDQARAPFADEAAADMVARYVLGARRGSRCSTQTLDRSIYRYSEGCYYEVVYIQGGNLLDDLRRRMGNTAFWAAMRRYVDEHRFGLAGTKWLLDELQDGSARSFDTTLQTRFPTLY